MAESDPALRSRIILVGALCGLAACAVYPILIFSDLPDAAAAALASAMGPLLGVASVGLREFLTVHRRTVAADLGAASNALAGALLTAMLLVQIAVGIRTGGKPSREAVAVWLGLDVAWDVYGGLGTLLFAFASLRHPRLGRIVGGAGIALAVLLLALNLWTFPTPPAEAGLIDVGPFVAAWYLVVAVLVLRSRRWASFAAGAERATARGLTPGSSKSGAPEY
jgi:hypothetical protein